VYRVHTAQVLEEQRLALHHRQPGLRADVAQAQHPRAVRDDGDHVALVGVLVDQFFILVDGATGRGHSGRVPDGEVVNTANDALRRDLDFAPEERMQPHCVSSRFFGFCEQFLFGKCVRHRTSL
jgi:hypothetical protein